MTSVIYNTSRMKQVLFMIHSSLW